MNRLRTLISMRRLVLPAIMVLGLVAALVAIGPTTGQHAWATSCGPDGDGCPTTTTAATTTTTAPTVEQVPAFSTDVPIGQLNFGPGGGGASSVDSSSSTYSGELEGVVGESGDAGSEGGSADGSAVATPSSTTSWVCTVYASNPWRGLYNGRYSIAGEGWQSCVGSGFYPTRLKVAIQQYRGLGYWATKYQWDSGYIIRAWLDRIVWWYCAAGSGTQTYRVVTRGYAGGLSRAVQSQNYLRVRCP